MITYQVLLLYPPPSRRYWKLPKAQNSTIISGQTGSLNSFCKLFEHAKFNFTSMVLVEWQSEAFLCVLFAKYQPPAHPPVPIHQPKSERETQICVRTGDWESQTGPSYCFPEATWSPEKLWFTFFLIFALDHQMTIRCQLTSSQSNFFWKLVCQISFQRILFLLIKSLRWIDWRRRMLRTLLSKIT